MLKIWIQEATTAINLLHKCFGTFAFPFYIFITFISFYSIIAVVLLTAWTKLMANWWFSGHTLRTSTLVIYHCIILVCPFNNKCLNCFSCVLLLSVSHLQTSYNAECREIYGRWNGKEVKGKVVVCYKELPQFFLSESENTRKSKSIQAI